MKFDHKVLIVIIVMNTLEVTMNFSSSWRVCSRAVSLPVILLQCVVVILSDGHAW